MAENEDRSTEDLTEEASPYRLEEFRRKGQVAQSREVSGILALLATGVAAYALSPKIGEYMMEYMRDVFRTDLSARIDLGSMDASREYIMRGLRILAGVGLPICLAGFVFGVAGSFAQIGSIFSTDPLTPDLNKINPLTGFKRIFSGKTAIELVRILFKLVFVCAVAYGILKTQIFKSTMYLGSSPATIISVYGQEAKTIFLALVGVMIVFAAVDFGMQKWEFSKQLRMTKQEAKQEHKEREGDPHIKARIRAIQREMSRKRMMQAVKKADVIITNPTHIAIALIYDRKTMSAPKVVAKGADFLAQRIKKVAAEAGVPLVENVPLARTLFKTVKINQAIPRALYQAVAEVLAYVYKLKNRSFQ